jgi:biotin-dependent carboxylase-like uncharacterized protein
MSLEVLEPGLMTLVQASPYRGTRHLGMPLAGAADPVAMAMANWMVRNAPETAALETAYAAVTLKAHEGCAIGVQGAATEVEVNGKAVSTKQAIALQRGDVLKIPPPAGGCRTYIAMSGGIGEYKTSTYTPARLGGFDGMAVPAGTILQAGAMSVGELRALPANYQLRHSMDFLLRVVAAPESGWIETNGLLDEIRTVGRRSDRIGLELEGTALKLLRDTPIDSSAVFPGIIQCPPSGQPFLLGPDAQTTGGYPRIAQVIRADRHLIGQLRPGARIRFQRVEPAEAQRLYRSKIALIRQLQPEFRLD